MNKKAIWSDSSSSSFFKTPYFSVLSSRLDKPVRSCAPPWNPASVRGRCGRRGWRRRWGRCSESSGCSGRCACASFFFASASGLCEQQERERESASASDLKQAHETIMQLQSELKDLKKKVQTQTLKGYNSSKKNMGNKSSKLKSKKTFAGKDGATDESAS